MSKETQEEIKKQEQLKQEALKMRQFIIETDGTNI